MGFDLLDWMLNSKNTSKVLDKLEELEDSLKAIPISKLKKGDVFIIPPLRTKATKYTYIFTERCVSYGTDKDNNCHFFSKDQLVIKLIENEKKEIF